MFKVLYIVLTFLFIALVLLQQKNATLGSMMGGDAGDEMAQTRRGAEKLLHQATIVLAILFLVGGLYAMFVA
ncbi:preprotein translocase subunit SecG [Candidatus Gracilibacteria bacterium]|nr:preprotein translocase subunit SecG [Candidatus Gracilibacteria bacterium]